MDPAATPLPPAIRCWALTSGEAGIRGQATGLAQAVGLSYAVKTAWLERPWRWLPGDWVPGAFDKLAPESDSLAPPWPDLLITCGRRVVALAIAIRRANHGRTLAVHIQNPRVPLRHFDLIAAPAHDRVAGANVIATRAGLHAITPERLAAAAAAQRDRFAALPRPLVAVLVGGASRTYRFSPTVARDLGGRLAAAARAAGAGLVVTTSRRTPAASAEALRAALAGLPGVFFWDGRGENPYLAMLGLADAIVVTADSVSMASEAAATGKPLHVAALPGGSNRFRRFHDGLIAAGIARPFLGVFERWTYAPPDDLDRVAARVRALLSARGD